MTYKTFLYNVWEVHLDGMKLLSAIPASQRWAVATASERPGSAWLGLGPGVHTLKVGWTKT